MGLEKGNDLEGRRAEKRDTLEKLQALNNLRDASSLIILAGGSSRRLNNTFKPLFKLDGIPLIRYVVNSLDGLCDEMIICVKGKSQRDALRRVLEYRVTIVEDAISIQSPLVGLYTGLAHSRGKYAYIAPCDMPFLDKLVYERMWRILVEKGVEIIIPVWPNGFVEPLVCVGLTSPLLQAVKKYVFSPSRVISVYANLNSLFVPVEELSPHPHITFMNINTKDNARKALQYLRALKTSTRNGKCRKRGKFSR